MDQMVSKHAKKNYQKEINNIWSFIFWMAPLHLFTQMENSLLKLKYSIYYRYKPFSALYVICLHNQLFVYNFSDTMCQHFANGKAHGNLCRSFCVSSSLIPQNCQTFHVGKEVVFSANFDDLPVSI